jgi:hypothetical protein
LPARSEPSSSQKQSLSGHVVAKGHLVSLESLKTSYTYEAALQEHTCPIPVHRQVPTCSSETKVEPHADERTALTKRITNKTRPRSNRRPGYNDLTYEQLALILQHVTSGNRVWWDEEHRCYCHDLVSTKKNGYPQVGIATLKRHPAFKQVVWAQLTSNDKLLLHPIVYRFVVCVQGAVVVVSCALSTLQIHA